MKNLKKIRTDVVGSLQRPPALKEARAKFDEGKLSGAEFRALEDQAVNEAVQMQETIGLDVLTDGEFRRLNFQDSFGMSVEGYDADTSKSTLKVYEKRVEGAAPNQRWDMPELQQAGTGVSTRRPTKARLRLTRNIPLEEYEYVSNITKIPAKVSIIGPDRISQRFDHQNSKDVYHSMDEFVDDVVRIEREIVESLIKAGARYIHIDAPGFTAYVDGPSIDQMRSRGEDPAKNFARSIRAESQVVQNLGDVTTAIHLCRGNQHSMWHREGSYDAIAERLFNELPHDRFLLEYDTPRAGSFEPLRFVPKGKVVVLGLVSTKGPELEKLDDLKRRIDEATKFIPLDQLAISPQCGFASDIVGNRINICEQKRKLERVVETARQIWG
jgi:5-methyltetrahydropteroyltriglutamate--homocysteine methyltransferase